MNWNKVVNWLNIFVDVSLIIMVVSGHLDMNDWLTKALLVILLIGSAYGSAVKLTNSK
jgi:hypothetical protein